MRRLLIILLLVLMSEQVALAQVQISEIMYDLEGADTNREWIEVEFTESLNFSDWKFFEANTNHRLVLVQGSDNVSSGDYAVIAKHETNFLSDNPSFTGTLFTSSFSLLNTMETLEIRTPEKETVDAVTYTSVWGASGDGNSLQFLSEWQACLPTPGYQNECPENEELPPPPPDPEPEPEPEVEQEEEEEEIDSDWIPEDLKETESAEDTEEDTEEETVEETEVKVEPLVQSYVEVPNEPELVYSSSAGNIKISMYGLLLLSVFLNLMFIVRR